MVVIFFWEMPVKQVEEFAPTNVFNFFWGKNGAILVICGGTDSVHYGFSLSITSFRI